MDWLELAVQNPIENAPIWIILLLAFLNVGKNFTRLMGNVFNTVKTENSLQAQLLDEMTARRVADERHRRTEQKFKRDLITIQQTSLSKIDKTTQATHITVNRIYEELKKQGVCS